MPRHPVFVICIVSPQCSNIFSSVTTWPIKAKFYVEPPWEGGKKVLINGPGYMTKMAATPIYGNNLQIFSGTGSPMILKLGMQHQGLKLYKSYIKDDTWLTLTYFYSKVKLGHLYVWGKCYTKSLNGENLQQRTKLTK